MHCVFQSIALSDLQDDLGGDTVGGDGVNRATSRRPSDLLNDRGNTSAQVGDL